VKTTGKILITCVVIFFWAVLCTAKSSLSAESVIDDVRVSRKAGDLVIQILLTFPMRYVSNIPLDEGDEIFIRLVPVSTAAVADYVRVNRESRTIPFRNIRVQYAGSNVGGPYLQVSFQDATRFKVRQATDLRSVEVVLHRTTARHEPTSLFDVTLDEAQDILLTAIENEKNGELGRAIQLYTKLTERAADPAIREEAQERLADARFSNKQYAHAKAEYQRYLQLYPEGVNSEEVQRKLNVILEGREDSGLYAAESGKGWSQQFYGEISQFLEQEGYKFDEEDFEHDISLITTDANLRYIAENSGYVIRGIVDSGYELALNDDGEDRGRVSSLYLEGESKSGIGRGRVGRSYANKGGVYGRYDGGELSIPLGENYTLNLVSGFPVFSSYDETDTDRVFYGVNVDYRLWGGRWELNTFYLYQDADGVTDREGVGGETRYTDRMKTLLLLADYDVHHRELSLALLTANLNIGSETTVSISGEYRQSPFLTTSNALIGQEVYDLDALLLQYDEEEIRQLAKDRSVDSTSAHLGLYHILNDSYQVGFDFAWSKLSDSETSGGVEGFKGTDNEFYYLAQVTGVGLLAADDIWTAKFHYSDTTYYDSFGPQLNSRFRIRDRLLFAPGIDFKYQNYKDENLEKVEVGPELRIEYKLSSRLTLEFEGGYWWQFRNGDTDDQSDEYYAYVGYYISI